MIAFHTDQIDVRGTCVALYDYASYNETLLGNKSVIIVPGKNKNKCEELALKKFRDRFELIFYDDLENVLQKKDAILLYCIKYGKNDGVYSTKVKTAIHCVFDLSEPHGDYYTAVSKSLAYKYGYTEYVPHMIGLSPSLTGENLRDKLLIPKDGIVFGRYGGMDTFNLSFCFDAIKTILSKRSDIYFLFGNTPVFYSHPRIFYLPPFVHSSDKNKFICTCDAHLECGTLGHSFGLAMGEFSVNNKPIIAYKPNPPSLLWNTAHLDILGDKALYFDDEKSFYKILDSFQPKDYKESYPNLYKDFSPRTVMAIFKKTFLLPA